MTKRTALVAAASTFAVAAACGIVACGGGGSSPTTPTNPGGGGTGGGGTATTTIIIGSDGRVSPASITVPVGSRVTFTNNHTQPHDMASDPHPDHTQCPAINAVGNLQPGQSRQTENLTVARTCGFHDHNQPSNSALQGTIRIQ